MTQEEYVLVANKCAIVNSIAAVQNICIVGDRCCMTEEEKSEILKILHKANGGALMSLKYDDVQKVALI